MLDIRNLTYSIGLRTLFEDASLFLGEGQKVGFIGVNGSGKTTLFRLIQRQIEPESGYISLKNGFRIATVKQEFEDVGISLLDFVLSSDKELKALYDELAVTQDGQRISEIYDRLNSIGANSAEARAGEVLHGLGFSNDDLKKPLSDFSGGWRVRAALAGTLFAPSELLLLDEPTNHLDLETTIWLENYLDKIQRAIIIISHDRHILNKICDKIVHLNNKQLDLYNGNYDTFERNYEIAKENSEAEAKRYDETRAHLQSFVDRFRYKASKASQAQSRIKMIEKMGDRPPVITDAEVQFKLPVPDQLPPYLITIENGVAGYGDFVVLKDLNLAIAQDDRIALVGANGNGKSTLAKVLAQRLPLISGKTTKSRKLKVAYFAQHLAEELDTDKTAFDVMSDAMGFVPEKDVRARLGGFGLNKSKSDTLIKNLSGGEKARLSLALITIERPHILIMDEPTNHLDIKSRDALIEALNNYEGAIILITHDMHLIELVCDRLWLVADGTTRHFDGDTSDYRQKIINGTLESSKAKNTAENRQSQKQSAADRRAALAPLKKELKSLEKEIAELNKQKDTLEKRLITQYSAFDNIELSKVTDELTRKEARWLEINEELEAVN
ncbi:ATP-binding cassette [Parelusimicrobium proximum]|uniref:ABC-F family ATP-binding cassette domain-containing protein n=1 Tax=Parelusimicrobium proximum TaxID=3228953 RepID=UPI003D172B72